MLAKLKRQWNEFKQGKPGRRFQDRYERNKETRSERSGLKRYLKPVAGILLFAVGVVFCLIPGPGVPLMLIAAGLLADVSLGVARVMDGAEVRMRKVIGWARDWWEHASRTAKNAVIFLGVFLASGVAYGGVRFVMARMS